MLLDETPGLLILAGRNADRAGASADRAIEHTTRTVPRAVVTVTVTTGLAALAVVFVQRAGTQVPKGREAGLGFVPGPFHAPMSGMIVSAGWTVTRKTRDGQTGTTITPDRMTKSVQCNSLGRIVTNFSYTPASKPD